MTTWIWRIRNSSLSIKLTLVFVGLFVLLSATISAAVYFTSEKNSLEQIRFSASQSFDQAMTYVDSCVQSALYASEIVRSAADTQQIVERGGASIVDLGDEYRAMRRIWNILLTLESGEIQNVRLYVRDGFTYVRQGVNFGSYNQLAADERYARLLNSNGEPVWFAPTAQVSAVELMRVIYPEEDYGEPIGALRVSLPAVRVEEIINKSTATATGMTFLVNDRDEIIAGSLNFSEFGADVAQVKRSCAVGDWCIAKIENEEYLARAQRVASTDWQLIALIPTREMHQLSGRTMLAMLGWLLPLLMIGVLMVWLLIGSVTRRVSMLSARMAHIVESGDLKEHVPVGAEDEIGKLCVSFNTMMDSLRHLANRQYEDGKAIKQAELRALQAQINPHFLYNTLDLMNWQALDRGAPELAELTCAMARFYRLSLSEGRDFVRLRGELEHVSVYVRIQNMRFAGSIALEIDVPDEVQELEVLKLLLQPLVENCVLHGMGSATVRTPVAIRISGRAEGCDLLLTVSDDGVGMNAEQLRNVLDTEPGQGRGFGVMNIHQRIRLCYGDGYGLRFASEQGAGTTVQIRMPARGRAHDAGKTAKFSL